MPARPLRFAPDRISKYPEFRTGRTKKPRAINECPFWSSTLPPGSDRHGRVSATSSCRLSPLPTRCGRFFGSPLMAIKPPADRANTHIGATLHGCLRRRLRGKVRRYASIGPTQSITQSRRELGNRPVAVQQSPPLAKNCDGAIDGFGDFHTTNCDVNQPLRYLQEYLSWAPFSF